MKSEDESLKFAIFSDVHANLPALESVLSSVDELGIRDIYCLGDLVDFAPWQNECIDLIRKRNIPVVCGNHDDRVAFDRTVTPLSWHSAREQISRLTAIEYSKSTLTPSNKEYLRTLPSSIKIDVGGGSVKFPILLVHASPTSLHEYIYEDHSECDLIRMLTDANVKAMITGHTHIAYVRHLSSIKDVLIVANTGAVGRIKKGQPNATWLEGEFKQGRLSLKIHVENYDVKKVAVAIKASDIPDYYAENIMRNSEVLHHP